MDRSLHRELDEAEARGRLLLAERPVAETAAYDAAKRRIVAELTDGRASAFPPLCCSYFCVSGGKNG